MQTIMRYWSNYRIIFFGLIIGALMGYAYYHFVGCHGQCMIASSPWRSTIYGMVMGALTADMFRKPKPIKGPNPPAES